jgi:hypothetical protein
VAPDDEPHVNRRIPMAVENALERSDRGRRGSVAGGCRRRAARGRRRSPAKLVVRRQQVRGGSWAVWHRPAEARGEARPCAPGDARRVTEAGAGVANVELPAIPRSAGQNSVSLPATTPNSEHLRPTRGPDAALLRLGPGRCTTVPQTGPHRCNRKRFNRIARRMTLNRLRFNVCARPRPAPGRPAGPTRVPAGAGRSLRRRTRPTPTSMSSNAHRGSSDRALSGKCEGPLTVQRNQTPSMR